jgi:16S rRNA A1518/A1519 N6-dimethyltransferase RsmA/KsgA/DIM1 with predicted DNA glycosylase/AP lyase activity
MKRISWRKGTFMHPFCHLVIKAIRYDPHPLATNRSRLSQLIAEHRANAGITQKTMAAQLGVSLKTFQNWENGRTIPQKRFWPPPSVVGTGHKGGIRLPST